MLYVVDKYAWDFYMEMLTYQLYSIIIDRSAFNKEWRLNSTQIDFSSFMLCSFGISTEASAPAVLSL